MNAPDKDLHDSITVTSVAGVEEAIREGADVNAPWHRDITPLQRAASQPLIVEQLLKAGADPNLADEAGSTALHAAACHPGSTPLDRHDVMTALLKAGADPNARDHRGHTPLHDAAMIPRETSGPVRLLLDAGADPAARDELGNLPLHYAAAHPAEGRAKAVGYLIHAHDSVQAVNEPNHSGKTPLHWAAARAGLDHTQTINRLLDAGADPTIQDHLGNLPLHYAAAGRGDSRPDAVSRLLQSSLRANRPNHAGNTPLHEAISRAGEGQAKAIARLLDAGADPTRRNLRGQSALDLAASLKNPVARTILERRHSATAYHREVSAYMAKHVEAGTAPWQCSYKPGREVLPQNLATGRQYQGGNSLYLMAVARDKGYSDPRWATFEQIKAAAGVVRKGETSAKIVWWDFSKAKDKVQITDREGKPILDDNGMPVLHHRGPSLKVYSVFNVEQAHNLKLQPLKQKPAWQAHRDADALIKASGVKIQHTQGTFTYYDPNTDTVRLPGSACFRDPESYYQNANHELGHATGHESRMNRDTLTEAREAGPVSPAGDRENLRADISALLTNTRLGLGHSSPHVGWTESSAKIISEDPTEFHAAARDAQKMSDYLIAPIRERQQDRGERTQDAAVPGQQQEPLYRVVLDKEQTSWRVENANDPSEKLPAYAQRDFANVFEANQALKHLQQDQARPAYIEEAKRRVAERLSDRMSAYRRSIPADHVELEARPTTDRPNGPIEYRFQDLAIPQDLQGLTKENFGYNQVIAHAPRAELQNHLRSLPEAERPTLETGPVR